MRRTDLTGLDVVILGVGREGRAAARALDGVAGSLVALDDQGGDAAAAWAAEVGAGVPVLSDAAEVLAAHPAGGVVVTSPGIPKAHPFRIAFAEAGWPLTSGTALWLAENAGSAIGVTGSKGKSTTSALIAHLLRALGIDAALGGNIGVPALDLAPANRTVLELSSYQCSLVDVSPDVVVLTSLFPEHLDWHGGEAAYYADKLNLVAHSPRRVVVNATDAHLLAQLVLRQPQLAFDLVGIDDSFHVVAVEAETEGEGAVRMLRYQQQDLFPLDRFRLLGAHNEINLCLAFAAALATGVPLEMLIGLEEAVAAFAPLEHRLEEIADPSGIVFVDDTLSTSPLATVKALEALADREVSLIVGGHDRGVDPAPLIAYLREHPIAAVVALPDTGEAVAKAVADLLPATLAADMTAAVVAARELTPSPGTVLLSPGASSYNVYANFEEKARDFRRAIAETA